MLDGLPLLMDRGLSERGSSRTTVFKRSRHKVPKPTEWESIVGGNCEAARAMSNFSAPAGYFYTFQRVHRGYCALKSSLVTSRDFEMDAGAFCSLSWRPELGHRT